MPDSFQLTGRFDNEAVARHDRQRARNLGPGGSLRVPTYARHRRWAMSASVPQHWRALMPMFRRPQADSAHPEGFRNTRSSSAQTHGR